MCSGVGSSVRFADRPVREHPGVGGRAAALQADGAGVASSAMRTKPPGITVQLVAVPRQKHAQDERPRLELAVAPHRHGRERAPASCTTKSTPRSAIACSDALRAASSSKLRAEHAFADGFGRQIVEIRRRDHHRVELGRSSSRARRHRPSHQVATFGIASGLRRATAARQRRQEGEHARALRRSRCRAHWRSRPCRRARPARGRGTPSRERALSSSGSAKSASSRRSSTSARRRPGDGADEHAVVAHREVFALDQQEAEIAREIGVLEIGLVHRPGRQQADAANRPAG